MEHYRQSVDSISFCFGSLGARLAYRLGTEGFHSCWRHHAEHVVCPFCLKLFRIEHATAGPTHRPVCGSSLAGFSAELSPCRRTWPSHCACVTPKNHKAQSILARAQLASAYGALSAGLPGRWCTPRGTHCCTGGFDPSIGCALTTRDCTDLTCNCG